MPIAKRQQRLCVAVATFVAPLLEVVYSVHKNSKMEPFLGKSRNMCSLMNV
jgi:hypothetical protein